MKMKSPLPCSQQKSCSLTMASPTNRRVNLTLDKAVEYELKHGKKVDRDMDRKKLRRMLSNRLSAQRSRMRRSEYVNHLKKMVKDLEDMILALTQQIESYKEKQKELLLQYHSLQKLVEIRSSASKISDIEIEQKRLEICRLRELEKALNNNSYNFNSGAKQMQDLRFNQLASQPYSLEFYQKGLRKLASNQLRQDGLPSSKLVQ